MIGHLSGGLAGPGDIRPVTVATLTSMYVFAAHRDAGVGGRLVAAFRSWAVERGADRLAVSAYASNDAAIRFYQRHGFTPRTTILEATP